LPLSGVTSSMLAPPASTEKTPAETISLPVVTVTVRPPVGANCSMSMTTSAVVASTTLTLRTMMPSPNVAVVVFGTQWVYWPIKRTTRSVCPRCPAKGAAALRVGVFRPTSNAKSSVAVSPRVVSVAVRKPDWAALETARSTSAVVSLVTVTFDVLRPAPKSASVRPARKFVFWPVTSTVSVRPCSEAFGLTDVSTAAPRSMHS
jgi:hypothetical protein